MKKRKNLFIYLLALILFISASSIKGQENPFYDGNESHENWWERKKQTSDDLARQIKEQEENNSSAKKILLTRQEAERESLAQEARIRQEKQAEIRANRKTAGITLALFVLVIFGVITFKNSTEFQQIIIPYVLPIILPLFSMLWTSIGQEIIAERFFGELVGSYFAVNLYVYYTDHVELKREGGDPIQVGYSLLAVAGLTVLGTAIGHLVYKYGGKEKSSQFSNEKELKMQYERLKNSRRKNNSTYWDYFVYVCLLLVFIFIFMGFSRRRRNRTRRYK